MSAAYDYAFLTLKRAPTPHPTLAAQLAAAGPTLRAAGGEILGQFAPQLGWANNEAAVLVRWAGARGGLAPVTGSAIVAEARVQALSPTIRPGDGDRLKSGGIHVHRWFEVDADSADEFVRLSGEGWKRFEAAFDAQIFGLFRAEPTAEDVAGRVCRLLLITRYGDHGVWEASRDPTTEAMQIFARRQQLTRRSWAASTRLLAT